MKRNWPMFFGKTIVSYLMNMMAMFAEGYYCVECSYNHVWSCNEVLEQCQWSVGQAGTLRERRVLV